MKNYKLKKHIEAKGYPLTSENYTECHREATRKEIEKFGLHKFHKLGILIPQHPKDLLGTNDIKGNIYISLLVPEKYREEVEYHEKCESKCLRRKHK